MSQYNEDDSNNNAFLDFDIDSEGNDDEDEDNELLFRSPAETNLSRRESQSSVIAVSVIKSIVDPARLVMIIFLFLFLVGLLVLSKIIPNREIERSTINDELSIATKDWNKDWAPAFAHVNMTATIQKQDTQAKIIHSAKKNSKIKFDSFVRSFDIVLPSTTMKDIVEKKVNQTVLLSVAEDVDSIFHISLPLNLYTPFVKENITEDECGKHETYHFFKERCYTFKYLSEACVQIVKDTADSWVLYKNIGCTAEGNWKAEQKFKKFKEAEGKSKLTLQVRDHNDPDVLRETVLSNFYLSQSEKEKISKRVTKVGLIALTVLLVLGLYFTFKRHGLKYGFRK